MGASSMLDDLATLWRHVRDFSRLLITRFGEHQGVQNAAYLTYTSLLSLVPLMTVVLAVFTAFPVADKMAEMIQDFVFDNFMPTSGEVLQQYLSTFTSKASRFTGVGSAFLLVVALLMMSSVDRALNRIWEVRRKRSLLNKFMVYWAILSLGPVLVGVSLVVTSYLVSLPLLSEAAAGEVGQGLLGLMPIGLSAVAFTLLYLVVPNRRVRARHALLGGVLAALLFEVAKRGFAYYVTTFPTYEAIYGALAIFPIFLIWVYLSWVIVLLGAEFSYCLGIYGQVRGGWVSRETNLTDAVMLMSLLGEIQHQGGSLACRRLSKMNRNWSEVYLDSLLEDLREQHMVLRTEDGKWALARDLSEVTLYELYRNGRFRRPQPGEQGWPDDPRLVNILLSTEQELERLMAVPLESFRIVQDVEQPAVPDDKPAEEEPIE